MLRYYFHLEGSKICFIDPGGTLVRDWNAVLREFRESFREFRAADHEPLDNWKLVVVDEGHRTHFRVAIRDIVVDETDRMVAAH